MLFYLYRNSISARPWRRLPFKSASCWWARSRSNFGSFRIRNRPSKRHIECHFEGWRLCAFSQWNSTVFNHRARNAVQWDEEQQSKREKKDSVCRSLFYADKWVFLWRRTSDLPPWFYILKRFSKLCVQHRTGCCSEVMTGEWFVGKHFLKASVWNPYFKEC